MVMVQERNFTWPLLSPGATMNHGQNRCKNESKRWIVTTISIAKLKEQ